VWLMPGAAKPAAVPGLIEAFGVLPSADAVGLAEIKLGGCTLCDKERFGALCLARGARERSVFAVPGIVE
jgi:hypothetical protein